MVGLGYAGLAFTAALLDAGLRVAGLDIDAELVGRLQEGREGHEPGVSRALESGRGRLALDTSLPDSPPPVVVVCVGTPFDRARGVPDLSDLHSAIDVLAPRLTPEHLVVLRSTLPIGGSDAIGGRLEAAAGVAPLLAYCPDRSIQGTAVAEIRNLPQVIGGSSPAAVTAATRFFARLTPSVLPMSSLRAAEFVKLANNSHTDVLYAFGNEMAFAAEGLGLDVGEILNATNRDYPRPDLAGPGWVGGSCLTKDPLAFGWSAQEAGVQLTLVPTARAINEQLATRAADFVTSRLGNLNRGGTVLLAGVAYKGRPETDDTRGGAAAAIKAVMADAPWSFLGHDFVVPPLRLQALGLVPVPLEEGVAKADAVIFCNDHPRYAERLDVRDASEWLVGKPVYDVWGVVPDGLTARLGSDYRRLGHG
ncbi:MAG: nucleotide sugar dehydrogenase [Acidimicrobiia bacterium]